MAHMSLHHLDVQVYLQHTISQSMLIGASIEAMHIILHPNDVKTKPLKVCQKTSKTLVWFGLFDPPFICSSTVHAMLHAL